MMMRDLGLLILRAGLGVTMVLHHGLPKLTKFSEMAPIFPDPIGMGSSISLVLAIFAELFCAALVVLGLGFRWVVIPVVGTMVVAFFIVHVNDPMQVKELAMVYLIGFSSLFLTGPGAFSLDSLLGRKKI